MISTNNTDVRNSKKASLDFSYHDVSFQELGRLQGDAYTVSVAWTDVTETKLSHVSLSFI